MIIFNKFVWSKTEPENKRDIWFDGSTIKIYTEGSWQVIQRGDIDSELEMFIPLSRDFNDDFNNDFAR